MKNHDPANPPRTVIAPSVASSSLNICMAANVRTDRATADTHEYIVGRAGREGGGGGKERQREGESE